MNVLYVKNQEREHVLNAKIKSVENIIIQNVQERKKFIWNNSICKRLSILSFANSISP